VVGTKPSKGQTAHLFLTAGFSLSDQELLVEVDSDDEK
jgi:hypothetical protein